MMKPITDTDYFTLIEQLEKFSGLSVKFKHSLRTILFEMSYKKGARILNAGSVQQNLWFMINGLAREIRVNSETFEENTAWFWFANSFLYTAPGFFGRGVSENTIELLEDSKMIMISYKDLDILKITYVETEALIEKIRAANDSMRQKFADDIRNLTTDERYVKHQRILNNLFGRTQLRYIGSYLGMSPDTLGKLRRKT